MAGQVTYTLSAFKRAGFVGRGGQLLLETNDDCDRAHEGFQRAIWASNEDFEALEKQELWAQANGPVPTPDGPMALVTECEPARALGLMLEKIARSLEREGIAGKLRPAKTVRHPVFGPEAFPALGLTVTLPVNQHALLASYYPWIKRPERVEWLVDAARTRSVVDRVLGWVLDVDGPVHVRVGASEFLMSPEAVPDFAVTTLPVDEMLRVTRIPSDSRLRGVCFSEYGGISIQTYDLSVSREGHLEELLNLLRVVAEFANIGYVRESSTRGGDRELLSEWPPTSELMTVLGRSSWAVTHLEDHYVYDACVAQVLTGSQLEKTRDLSPERWSVEDLGNDRHLVVHRQPRLWFDEDPTPLGTRAEWRVSPVVEPVLAQARDDFGDAIMTPRTLEEHPPDLPHDELVRAFGNFHLTPRLK